MTNHLLPADLIGPQGSIDAYIHMVNQVPTLSIEEERGLTKQLSQENNLDAARQLVLSHLRYVVYVARGYSGYGLPQADLIQEGNIGLMKAVKRFDPSHGVRLISFAVHWIRAEIHEFILRNWRIVKVATTKAQRKLFFNLRKTKKRLGWFTQEEVQAVAQDLGVSPETVLEMEQRLSNQDASFEAHAEQDEHKHEYQSPASYLQDVAADPAHKLEKSDWEEHTTNRLHRALNSLDERSRDILGKRWLNNEKSTLQDLADFYNISAERIRQLEKNALKKLQKSLDTQPDIT